MRYGEAAEREEESGLATSSQREHKREDLCKERFVEEEEVGEEGRMPRRVG